MGVPGALPNGAGAEVGDVAGFTVNGQRANSNNMTNFHGVGNIDMVTTAATRPSTPWRSSKLSPTPTRPSTGRAVGAQLQVVTKSGSRDFHGSRATVRAGAPTGPANSFINKRVIPEVPKAQTSRNDSGVTIGGPVFFPGFNEEKRKLFFFFSQEHQRRVENNAERRTRCATWVSERRGDFSQSVDTSGNLFPYIRRLSERAAVQRVRHARVLPGRRRAPGPLRERL